MINYFFKIKNFIERNHFFYLALFVISFALFFYVQDVRTFADPDSFYHAKMAVLIKEQGLIKNFPWLQFTTLKDNYVDGHLLYHFLLIPFIIFLDPLVGVKLAAIVFASSLIVIIYWFLKKFRVKAAGFYCLLLLVINPFIFRISLAKVPVLANFFLVLTLYFLFSYRAWPLFILSFFYVWLYAGWPLTLVLTLTFIAVSSLFHLWRELNRKEINLLESGLASNRGVVPPRAIPKLFFKKFFSGRHLRLLLANFNGLLAGLIINPYFPKNLYFYWQQTIEIGLINYQKIISVGGEWYPYQLSDLVIGASLLFMLLLVALVVFVISYERQTIFSWTLFLLAAFFFLFTLKARRNVEYFVPFAVLFSAWAINNFLVGLDLKAELSRVLNWFRGHKFRAAVLTLYFVGAISFIAARDVRAARRDFEGGFAFDKLKAPSQWLENNVPAGSIIFHNAWDEFPLLFYYNSKDYYLVGLDVTFMYNYSPNLYWEWYRIVTGEDRENLYSKVKNDFRASYVLWTKERTSVEESFGQDSRFKLLNEDQEAKIYQVL